MSSVVLNIAMNYAKEIGSLLAEQIQELILLEEMPLNEIRDLKTLKSHMKAAAQKYGTKHPKYKALQHLAAKKQAAEERKAAKMSHVKDRQEHHAKAHNYKRVKGSPNTWVHESGHTLTFGDDRSWNHVKAGKKKGVGGGATPIRALRDHLRSLHEEMTPQGEDLNEIRGLISLRQRINQGLLSPDPMKRQETMRLQALERRKKQIAFGRLGMGESEEMNEVDAEAQAKLLAAMAGMEKTYGKGGPLAYRKPVEKAPEPKKKRTRKKKPAYHPPSVDHPANPAMAHYDKEFLKGRCNNCGAHRYECGC